MNILLKIINGPEAKKGDIYLTHIFGILAACYQLWVCISLDLHWYSCFALTFVMYDLVGGVISNLTYAGKKWWHGICHNRKRRFLFIFIHVHPFFFIPLFDEFTWTIAALFYVYLIGSTIAILYTSEYFHLPVASIFFIFALILIHLLLPGHSALFMILPLYYLKLLIAFLCPLKLLEKLK